LIVAAMPHAGAVLWTLLLERWSVATSVQLVMTLIYFAVAWFWLTATRPSRPITLHEAIILVALSWVLVPLLSAIPVTLAIHVPLVDSWFEAVSGFTTTGLSVFSGQVDPAFHVYVPSVDELPWSVQAWRALTQWLGGFGVVVVFYAFARIAGLPAHLVGFAEGRLERLEPSIARSLRAFMWLYTVLTGIDVVLLYAAGMPLNDAVYHAMTAISTGGFSDRGANIGYYHSFLIEAATVAAMILGALNFADLYALFKGQQREMSVEEKTFFAVWVPSVLIGLLLLMHSAPAAWSLFRRFREAFFDTASALTTTGFGIASLSHMSPSYKFLLTILMFIGGSAFSTAGGIKLYRLAVLGSTVKWSWARVIKGPHYITSHKVGSSNVDFEELARVIEVVFLFALLDVIGTMIILVTVPHATLADAAFEATSALCTTGLSVGITSAATPLPAKLTLLALMDLGRLEIHVYIAAIAVAAAALRGRVRSRTTVIE